MGDLRCCMSSVFSAGCIKRGDQFAMMLWAEDIAQHCRTACSEKGAGVAVDTKPAVMPPWFTLPSFVSGAGGVAELVGGKCFTKVRDTLHYLVLIAEAHGVDSQPAYGVEIVPSAAVG